MNVSKTKNIPGIELTEEANELIERLVYLDTAQIKANPNLLRNSKSIGEKIFQRELKPKTNMKQLRILLMKRF